MRRETAVILIVIAAVFVPMWLVALASGSGGEVIEIRYDLVDIRPLEGFLDVPGELTPSQVGVVTWLALFGLIGLLAGLHRFMEGAVRPRGVSADGGAVSVPDWFSTETRRVLEYRPGAKSVEGLVAVSALSVLAIACAALFAAEFAMLARTQYIGIYATGMFLSLAAMTAAYYAWFMPHVEVAEVRGHDAGGDSR